MHGKFRSNDRSDGQDVAAHRLPRLEQAESTLNYSVRLWLGMAEFREEERSLVNT